MNKSISTDIYSHLLKHAKVIPVYKTGDETHPRNYRPTSLLSVFNRLFEKLMYKRLRSYCEKNGIFFSSQYGFRGNCSTQHAILDILNKIQSKIDAKLFSCGIFITRASVNGKPESENATVFLAKRGLMVPGVSCVDCGNWG